MNRVFKIYMLWLLVMAIPLQGIAAVGKWSCGSMHQAPWSAVSAHAGHSHGEAMEQHHHHHHVAATVDHAAGDVSGHGPASHGKHGPSSCSACAACCIGTAVIPSGFASIAVHASSEPVALSPPALVTGYIPAGLERPPRSISA